MRKTRGREKKKEEVRLNRERFSLPHLTP